MMITSISTSSYAIHTDAFKSVYIAYQFENAINTTIIRILQSFHHYCYAYCRLLANGTRIFHMECCYSFITVFGQKTSAQSPLVEPQNMFTPHFSTHLQVTHYASSLMKHCFRHFIIVLNVAFNQQLL